MDKPKLEQELNSLANIITQRNPGIGYAIILFDYNDPSQVMVHSNSMMVTFPQVLQSAQKWGDELQQKTSTTTT